MANGVLNRFRKDERGAILVLSTFAIAIFVMFMAGVFDLAYARMHANRLQIAADAGALAGATELPSEDDAIDLGKAYARENYVDDGVVRQSDVEVGYWNGLDFLPNEAPTNAIRVNTYRDIDHGGNLRTVFASVLGWDDTSLSGSAIAAITPQPGCEGGGFFASGNVISNSNNSYVSGFCLFGGQGVDMGSNNSFEDGAVVAVRPGSQIVARNNNAGLADAKRESEMELGLPSSIPGIAADMQAGNLTALPEFVSKGPVFLDEITQKTTLTPGTLYVVSGEVELGRKNLVPDIAIYSADSIEVVSNSVLTDVMLVSEHDLTIGSNVDVEEVNQITIASGRHCVDGSYDSYLLAKDDISFGSNTEMEGLLMATMQNLTMGANVLVADSVYAEADGDIEYGSYIRFSSCDTSLQSEIGQSENDLGDPNVGLVR